LDFLSEEEKMASGWNGWGRKVVPVAAASLWVVEAARSIPSGKKFVGRYVVAALNEAAAMAVVAGRFGSSANVKVYSAVPVNGGAYYLGMERVS
jgi:hypothetical protein